MSLASFYNNPDLRDGFNIWPHPWRSQPHRGLDFGKTTGTAIPSVNSGTVVISEWNPYLGWIVEVRGDDGTYMGYCHLHRKGLPVGSRVSVGTTIGPVGNTGSQSQGAHLHITRGRVQGAVRGGSISNLSDPWPYIQAAINGGVKPPSTPSKGKAKMLMIHRPKAGRNGQTLYAVFAEGFWLEFVGQDVANGFARQIGASSVEVSEAFWNTCKRVAGV